jgi:hypothetical protein
MSNPRRFLFDANAFIEAKRRYYAFDLCPGYWDAVLAWHAQQRLLSIDRVGAELQKGNDDLKAWAAAAPAGLFADSGAAETVGVFGRLQTWVAAQAQFLPQAKAEFASKADAWLIAHAKANGMVLVTHEVFAADARSKVPMPNACKAFQVEHVTTFDALRELGVKFTWAP